MFEDKENIDPKIEVIPEQFDFEEEDDCSFKTNQGY